ncbi:hypothetical protein PHMEG_00036417 [Phytophthora megakarya]|uniref:Eukaryotic/viral aspartic protease n=1 Tax=Phytophthora megakarya TaxID=4795 RepID=A0A225UM34_9STRA|nr:hypothetical protein PHMEG_00036417 [Phytophthora megakarya]
MDSFVLKKRSKSSPTNSNCQTEADEFNDRPNTRLAAEVTDASRLDFDEKLLPEDSWEPEHVDGEYEVEAILDDRVPLSTSTERAVRELIQGKMGGLRRTNMGTYVKFVVWRSVVRLPL